MYLVVCAGTGFNIGNWKSFSVQNCDALPLIHSNAAYLQIDACLITDP